MVWPAAREWEVIGDQSRPRRLLGICFWGGELGGAVEGDGEGRKGVAGEEGWELSRDVGARERGDRELGEKTGGLRPQGVSGRKIHSPRA